MFFDLLRLSTNRCYELSGNCIFSEFAFCKIHRFTMECLMSKQRCSSWSLHTSHMKWRKDAKSMHYPKLLELVNRHATRVFSKKSTLVRENDIRKKIQFRPLLVWGSRLSSFQICDFFPPIWCISGQSDCSRGHIGKINCGGSIYQLFDCFLKQSFIRENMECWWNCVLSGIGVSNFCAHCSRLFHS